ncbi:MAG: sulfurtransferase [Paucibacter sp.]|nr:sulfurtransferase [Roseateles sp.]
MSRILTNLALLALAAPLMAAQAVELPGPVVDTAWLAAHLDEVQVLEVRSNFASFAREPAFETDAKTGKKTLSAVGGHLPGAHLIDFKNVRGERQAGENKLKFMLPERAEFQSRLRAAGVQDGLPIVLVPVGQEVGDVDEALRLFWSLRVYGAASLAVLDGGAAGWIGEGRPVSTAAAPAQTGNWTASPEHNELLADSETVAAAASHGVQLVDGRPQPQYYGLNKSPAVASFGHIDGARNFAPELLTRDGNGALRFLPARAYEALMRTTGIDPKADSITYCNTGHLASGPWFVMHEILGNPSTRLYDGSLSRWTQEKRPLVAVQ